MKKMLPYVLICFLFLTSSLHAENLQVDMELQFDHLSLPTQVSVQGSTTLEQNNPPEYVLSHMAFDNFQITNSPFPSSADFSGLYADLLIYDFDDPIEPHREVHLGFGYHSPSGEIYPKIRFYVQYSILNATENTVEHFRNLLLQDKGDQFIQDLVSQKNYLSGHFAYFADEGSFDDYSGDVLSTYAMSTGTPANQPPVADAGPDQAIIEIGSTVQLDGTQSYDLDGDTITYNWSIVSKPEGSIAELSNPASPTPTFQADIHGDYIIELVVSDGTTSSIPDQVIVTFDNAVPVANTGSNQSVMQGDQVCFDGNGSMDDNGDTLSFYWSLIAPDGSTASLDDPSAKIACLTTDLPGTYEATLIVNDGWVDSPSSTASAYAASYQDATTITLQETITTINDIPLDDFKNKNMQNILTNKVNAALALIEQGAYAEALDKLQNDLLGKTDGCATSGSPDKNDWIEDCTSQGQIYPLIIDAIEYVTELSKGSTNNQYFQMLLASARVGDILLFSQCNGDVVEPLNCSAIIPEFLGYGYFSHAAIISEINANSLTYLHAYPGAGIESVTVSPADLVAYTSIMLLTVSEVQDTQAIAIVDYGYNSWNGTEYDSDFLPFNSKMYCSELVYEIYNEFGVSLNDASYYPLGLITPDNLLQSGATESVMAYSPIR